MSGETLRAPRQQLRRLRASRLRFIFGALSTARHSGAPYFFFARPVVQNHARRIGLIAMPRGGTWIQRWRVPLGFLCAAIFVVLAQPRLPTLLIGGLVSLLGLALRAWSAGHIRKNETLARSGPYAFTRNPLYLGSFILGLGFTIGAGRLVLGIVFAALFLGIYLPVMRVESRTLAETFGDEYHHYASYVPLFFPRLRP
jgi:protein-S-isoprenylcysteine O-methyltransferase Ste14